MLKKTLISIFALCGSVFSASVIPVGTICQDGLDGTLFDYETAFQQACSYFVGPGTLSQENTHNMPSSQKSKFYFKLPDDERNSLLCSATANVHYYGLSPFLNVDERSLFTNGLLLNNFATELEKPLTKGSSIEEYIEQSFLSALSKTDYPTKTHRNIKKIFPKRYEKILKKLKSVSLYQNIKNAEFSLVEQKEGLRTFDADDFWNDCFDAFISGSPSQAAFAFFEKKYNTLLWWPACMLSLVFRELHTSLEAQYQAKHKTSLEGQYKAKYQKKFHSPFLNKIVFAPDGHILGDDLKIIKENYPDFAEYCHDQCIVSAGHCENEFLKSALKNVAEKFRS